MTKIIDTKSDTSVRVLTDVEVLDVAGAGPTMSWPRISSSLVAAIERLKSELHVALPRP
jgi:hypothetical protein